MSYKVVAIKQGRDLGLWDQRLVFGPFEDIEEARTTGREHKAAGAFDVHITSDSRLGMPGSGKFYLEEWID